MERSVEELGAADGVVVAAEEAVLRPAADRVEAAGVKALIDGDQALGQAGAALEPGVLAVQEGAPVTWDGGMAVSEAYNTLEFTTPLGEPLTIFPN